MKEKDLKDKLSGIEKLTDDQLEAVAGAAGSGNGAFVSIEVCRKKCFSNGQYMTILDPICRGICRKYQY